MHWLGPILLGAIAVFLRICNIGTFSLWLDEVFTMRVASQPLLTTLARCAEDAENVPVYAVVANLGLKAGLDDPWIRLLPIAAGLASIVLLAGWTRRHFGAATTWLAAAFCVFSPFHVRYSQELRAYPYLLLVCTATLVLADRLRSHPDWKTTFALAATIALGFYTNLTYALVLVPVAGLMLVPPTPAADGGEVSLRLIRRRFASAVFLGALAFVPWIWLISQTLVTRIARTRTTDWTWLAVGQRWECLTIAPGHFNLLSWFGVFLAVVFVIGIIAAAKTPTGRAVLLPALATIAVWEVVLVVVEHWSAPRYDTALWPFLAVLIALGFERVLRLLRWRPLRWAACAVVAALLLVRVDAYHRFGRPHWDRFADAVREIQRPGEKVVTIDHWAMKCLSYYLDSPVVTIADKPHRLRKNLETSPSVLVISRGPLRQKFLTPADTDAELGRIPRTGGLYRLRRTPTGRSIEGSEDAEGRPETWPEPVAERIPKHFEREAPGCLGRWFGQSRHPRVKGVTRIDFTRGDPGLSGSGWARPRKRDDGTTWASVEGPEASIDLGPVESAPHRLSIRLAPFPGLSGPQWVRAVLNGEVLGERPLQRGTETLTFQAPARFWLGDRNLLVLQFSRVARSDGTGRSRSAEVDWIEWTPRRKAAGG
jgi:hypothetical protein